MTYVAGIDLGTTFTAAAVCRGGESRPEIVSLGDRAASIPSVVLVRGDSMILTGDAASRRAVLEPDRVAREFKRRLGDPTPLLLGGAPHSPESLQAKLLCSVYDAITQHEGGPPDQVTVTYPANWGAYKRELFTQTLRMAGLQDALTVTEPEASAIHYASNERIEPGEIVAVYDLGGGTFDAAVLRKTEEGFQSLGVPEGLEHLGGVDFDHSILQHVNAALGGALDRLDFEDPTARADLARLRADCAEAKEALSTDTEVTIPVSVAGTRTEVRLTRAELDEMVRPAVAETIDSLRRAIASAGISVDDVSRVLLVGGASRMPIVSRMVATEIGRPVFLDAHPKHAIALGAALTARPKVAIAVNGSEEVSLASQNLCPDCGYDSDADDVYCGGCGRSVEPIGEPVTAASATDALPPPPSSPKRRRPSLVLAQRNPVSLAILVTLIGAIVGYALFLRPQAEASGVLYQDPTTRGPSPFTDPAVDKELAPASSEVTRGDSSSEDTPHGPFGGSGVLTKCNKKMLVKFLNSHPDRKEAWSDVLGVELKNFDEYIASLRSATVKVDTRVTNHGFKNGRAFELQSILAKGTAVLVDPKGNIVTRCYCGNPLTPPKPQGTSTCTDCPRGYVPPPACDKECYALVSDTERAGETSEDDGAADADRNGRASTLSQPGGGSGDSEPRVQTFSGQTTPQEDDDGSGSTNNSVTSSGSGQTAPQDDAPSGGGYLVGPTPPPAPKKCSQSPESNCTPPPPQ